jgi:phenylacetate-CoA ligase
MQARVLPPGHGNTTTFRSSGSTGLPTETTQTYLTAIAGRAAQFRADQWHGINYDQSLLNLNSYDSTSGVWPEGTVRGPWSPAWLAAKGVVHEFNLMTTPAQIVEVLTRDGSYGYLAGLPSRLEAVAYAAERLGARIALDAVLARGQAVSEAQRELFQDVFGARTVSRYSSQETSRIAHPCPECGHFHVNAEIILVEIVDGAGRQVPPGAAGSVVLTPFYNTAQPLIRYDIGDLAVRGGTCRCGRILPVIEAIVGRVYNLFRLQDGTRMVPAVAGERLAKVGVGMWQLAQTAPWKAQLRYTRRRASEPADEAAAKQIALAGLPPGFEVAIKRLEDFDGRGPRKHALYVCELP